MSKLGPFTVDESSSFSQFSGITLAIIQVCMIVGGSAVFRNYSKKMIRATHKLNAFTYYWFMFTMFTGFMWESSFVAQYHDVNDYSEQLIAANQTVWFNKYTLDYLLPWKFSKIFYGDYGAYADREYMVNTNDWSRVIESTHAIMCAMFALLAFVFGYFNKDNRMSVCVGASMGTQLMNSVLYMAEYAVQMEDPDNVNYPTKEFPAGTLLIHRPFMWVNVFWTIFPLYILIVELLFKNGQISDEQNSKFRAHDYTKCCKEMEKVKLLSRNSKRYVTFEDTDIKNEIKPDVEAKSVGVETRAAKKQRLEGEKHHELVDMATNY